MGNPYGNIPIYSTHKYANDPNRKKANYDYFLSPFEAVTDQLMEAGTPFPNAPNWDARDKTPPHGPGWEQMLGFLANTGAAAGSGLGMAATGITGALLDPFNSAGEWLEYGNSPAPGPAAAGAPQPQPGIQAGPQTAPGDALAGLNFDQMFSVAGSGTPMPGMPGQQNNIYSPDFTKTDELLQRAAPKRPQHNRGEELVSGAGEGLAQAAGRIDPHKNWGTALGQLISGAAQGVAMSKRQMDQRELEFEQRQEEYNLKLAGVEAVRAEALAKAKVDQSRVHNEIVMNQWKQQVAQWEMSQPTVQMLGDGSFVSMNRDLKTGQMNVQRMGQEDQFKIAQAMAAAKGQGKEGSALTQAAILKKYGPAGAQLAAIAELGTVPGVLRSLIPQDQLENFEEELQNKLVMAQGLSGEAQGRMAQQIEQSLYIKYILGDPFARQRLHQFYAN